MNLEKMPEIQSARVGLPVVDKLPKDGAHADNKKGHGRTVLYARVSTAEQTLAHQRAQAEAAGDRDRKRRDWLLAYDHCVGIE